AVAIAAVAVARWPRGSEHGAAPAAGDAGTGAAKFAPRGPTLPADPNGVRLSGLVVDTSGAAVAGVEVSAELERGAIDRALSITPRTPSNASGSGSAGSGASGVSGGAGASGVSGVSGGPGASAGSGAAGGSGGSGVGSGSAGSGS